MTGAGPAAARSEPPTAVSHRCPLCGGTFAEEPHCSVCPMSRRCQILCCPNCGYSFVETSTVVNLFRRALRVLGVRERAEGEGDRG